MQINETLNEGLKRAYTLIFSAKDIKEELDKKLEKARPEIMINGFRKGKAPLTLLRRRFGPGMMVDVVSETVNSALKEHYENSGAFPAFEPELDIKTSIEDVQNGADLEIHCAYEALPEIPEVDLSSISLEILEAKPDEADLEEELSDLAEEWPVYKHRTDEKGAQAWDKLILDTACFIDGKVVPVLSTDHYTMYIRERTISLEFDTKLIGIRAGETRRFSLGFPKSHEIKEVAGNEADFTVTAREVYEPFPCEINDELAKKCDAENIEALRDRIRSGLESQYREESLQLRNANLLNILDDLVKFEVPPTLLADEIRRIEAQDEEVSEAKRKNSESLDDSGSVTGAGESNTDEPETDRPDTDLLASQTRNAPTQPDQIKAETEKSEDTSIGKEEVTEPVNDGNDESADGADKLNARTVTRLAERRVRLGLFVSKLGKEANIEVRDSDVMNKMLQQYRELTRSDSAATKMANKFFPVQHIREGFRSTVLEDAVLDYIVEFVNVTRKPGGRKELDEAFDALDRAHWAEIDG